MNLDAESKRKLARLAAADRKAQERAEATREAFLDALIGARGSATVRELADIVGLSFQRVHELTSGGNYATRRKRQARATR